MTASRRNPHAPARPRRSPIRPGWPEWAAYAAAAWSLAYGLLGLYWTVGGAGFPFGATNDPDAARVSTLEHVRQGTTAPAIAALGLVAALVAMVMARRIAQGLAGAALSGFAWTMAVALAVVLPDIRPLIGVAAIPIILIGQPFGWPTGVGLSTLFPWPVVNQLLLILGGLLWAATAVAYRRRSRNACGHCGRTDDTTGWTTPCSAARWGRWATAIAVAIPLLYALTRWAWALGIPSESPMSSSASGPVTPPSSGWPGPPRAPWRSAARSSPWGWSTAGARSSPHWIPVLGGKPVRPRTAIIPAVLVTSAGLGALPRRSPRRLPRGHRRESGDGGAQVPVAVVGRRLFQADDIRFQGR